MMKLEINPKCAQCIKKCKQTDKVEIIYCPNFESKDKVEAILDKIKQ